MKSVPKFMQEVYRCAMRYALDVVVVGELQGDVLAQTERGSCFSSFRGCSDFAPAVEVRCPRRFSEGASFTTGDERILKALKDRGRRPALPREFVPPRDRTGRARRMFLVGPRIVLQERSARKGAAPGTIGHDGGTISDLWMEHVVVAAGC